MRIIQGILSRGIPGMREIAMVKDVGEQLEPLPPIAVEQCVLPAFHFRSEI